MIRLTSCFIILTAFLGFTFSQTVPSAAYQELEYRMIGPFRAGRTVGAVGIPTQPNVFFIGVNNGGVWKTDDYGRTWRPIFDKAPTGSVGDIAVSPIKAGRFRLSVEEKSLAAKQSLEFLATAKRSPSSPSPAHFKRAIGVQDIAEIKPGCSCAA